MKYYAMPFLKDARQNIVRGDMEYARSARHAWQKAQAMMTADVVGSIAFSRTEGSISGTLGAPIVLKAFGEVEKTMKNF